MEQIFTNLIDNAIKYKSPNKQPVIKISAWEQDNLIYISFKDNGIGIPSANHESIFEKEVRVLDKNSTIQGHGLGLYNVRKMVEANKGKIELTHSRPEEGSLFTLSFPTHLD
jgi:two-component system phosphate regulon sensor histidine kinase PhoR